ncbi:hypothetical protein, partial [uncultured Agitococcus sp.]|uniref:hypothetical protein n=1 Tax=uncultured Agitococcus sp. TaxID=1506599 RepID=UPI002639C2E1
KLAHVAKGIHILCTKQFLEGYQSENGSELGKFLDVGNFKFKGSDDKINVFRFGPVLSTDMFLEEIKKDQNFIGDSEDKEAA